MPSPLRLRAAAYAQIYVNLIVPVPGIALGAIFLLRDVWGAYDGGGGSTGHAGHVGGTAAGAAAYALLRLRGR